MLGGKDAAATLAVDIFRSIVQKQLSPEDHARLVREAVESFPSKN